MLNCSEILMILVQPQSEEALLDHPEVENSVWTISLTTSWPIHLSVQLKFPKAKVKVKVKVSSLQDSGGQ
jgi:hypothetical protein